MKIKARMTELKVVYATFIKHCIDRNAIPTNTSMNLNDHDELQSATKEYIAEVVTPLIVEYNILEGLFDEFYRAYCNGHSDGRTGGTLLTEFADYQSSNTFKEMFE